MLLQILKGKGFVASSSCASSLNQLPDVLITGPGILLYESLCLFEPDYQAGYFLWELMGCRVTHGGLRVRAPVLYNTIGSLVHMV